ncbi:MAG: alpha/beta hydrolase, partial [Gemmatimonadota bacterium]|nr:alpha/beta hydrolase [Gemmatimonadota bacterium]
MKRRSNSLPTKIRRIVFRIFGTAFPDAASRWFERLIITPSRYTNPKDGTPPPDGNHSSVPFNRGMLSVWTWGPEDGPAVILVHGWGGKAAHLLEFVRPLAQNGFRVVAYDQPAHGLSHGTTTTLVECGEALLEIGRHLGKVHGIIAHSFGCPTAAYAIKNGLKIERMVFLGSPASIVELGQDIAEYIGLPRRVAEIMQE